MFASETSEASEGEWSIQIKNTWSRRGDAREIAILRDLQYNIRKGLQLFLEMQYSLVCTEYINLQKIANNEYTRWRPYVCTDGTIRSSILESF